MCWISFSLVVNLKEHPTPGHEKVVLYFLLLHVVASPVYFLVPFDEGFLEELIVDSKNCLFDFVTNKCYKREQKYLDMSFIHSVPGTW